MIRSQNFAVGIQFIEKWIGIARPGDELVFHLDSGLRREILAQLDESVGQSQAAQHRVSDFACAVTGDATAKPAATIPANAKARVMLCFLLRAANS